MSKETKEVVKKEEAGLPVAIDFSADAGVGFEETNAADFAIPFLRLLQSLSPQAKKKDPAYIPNSEEGDFINTVTEQLYKGDDGVLVVPVHYVHKYILWGQNRSGFKGAWTTEEYATNPKQRITISTSNGPMEVEADMDGNIISDTREHYVIIVKRDGSFEPALIALSASQIKKSRKWMTLMQGIRIGNAVAPMFSQTYKITSMQESNDRGSWSGVKVEHAGVVSDPNLYAYAKQFREMVRSGAVKAAPVDDIGPDDENF